MLNSTGALKPAHFGRYKFDVALSFASEQREYAKIVARRLKKAGLRVFYDADIDVQLDHLGKRFSELAQTVYGKTAEFVVVLASKEYVAREWTFNELAFIVDRMRKDRFQSGQVFFGVFGEVQIPAVPEDVMYTQLDGVKAEAYAKLVSRAVARRRSVDQDSVLALFAKERYEEISVVLSAALLTELSYRDRVFSLYCRACALSRLAEEKPESDQLLGKALEDLADCMDLVSAQKPEYLDAFSKHGSVDDDLLELRIKRTEEVSRILRSANLLMTASRKSNADMGDGCVSPDSNIMTPKGPISMRDVQSGMDICCYDHASMEPQVVGSVLKKNTFQNVDTFRLNDVLEISATQPIFERTLGWICLPDLKLGMQILRDDSSFETINSITPLGSHEVMVVSVSHPSHTFIANGVVCHNVHK